jgi:hypothetical protein
VVLGVAGLNWLMCDISSSKSLKFLNPGGNQLGEHFVDVFIKIQCWNLLAVLIKALTMYLEMYT